MKNIKFSINLSTLFLIISLAAIFNSVQIHSILNYVDETTQEVLEVQKQMLDIWEEKVSDQETSSTENTKYPKPFVEKANGKLLPRAIIESKISTISTNLEYIKKEYVEKMQMSMVSSSENIQEPKIENNNSTNNLKLAQHDDLMVFEPITEEEMNKIINDFQPIMKTSSYESPFIGRGDVFIKASEKSGLNPLYIFAHAALESDYGRSSMARNKGNYFGIGAFDSSPSSALDMGDSFESGIINGAVWIKQNFYDNGQKTLHDMQFKYPRHYYASSGQKWINDILWIANKYV